ncbi:MAG: hypothetical protein V7K41_15300 [Nostoc sp.]|uniref:hypothetical protein n=1 Tax=Nostoc sp. TaxID=1180 RepID=UPI002FF62BAB
MSEEKRGKTISITNRLPSFYDAENVESLLYKFVDIFGYILEQGESDLLKVMRSHFVDTADNQGSQGFVANKKGDLDQIFILYLEALGGTSQLMQANYKFYPGSIRNISLFAKTIQEGKDALSRYLRQENRDILKRFHISRAQFNIKAFKNAAALAIKILIAENDLSKYLKNQLSLDTLQILEKYDGSQRFLEDKSQGITLYKLLERELNQQLINPYFYRKNRKIFDKLLIKEQVKQLIKQQPTGENLQRLNRMLLEAAYPEEIVLSNIPSEQEVEQTLINSLNNCLNQPELLNAIIKSSIPNYYQDKPLEIQNRILLTTAYPNHIENIYAPYRERLKGLIQILRRGAATKQGIIDIVAANLGIVGNDVAAQDARNQIQFIEFMPELTWVRPEGASKSTLSYTYPLALFQNFEVQNPNRQEEDVEIRIQVLSNLPVEALVNPTIININSQYKVTFTGELKPGDVLLFRGQTASLNGQVFSISEATPKLPQNNSEWRFTADIKNSAAYPVGLYNQQNFDTATFAFAEAAINLEMRLYKLTPGVFEVKIPWDIPGFTDKFDESENHPRNQISGIVDKVKAAGVLAIITYEKAITEIHDYEDYLTIVRSPFQEEHLSEEINFTVGSYQLPYPQGMKHDISDNLVFSGVFDYTGFDTSNRFG